MSISAQEAREIHAAMLAKAVEASGLHIDRRLAHLKEDPEATLNANDRQLFAAALKFSEAQMNFAAEAADAGAILAEDKRYKEMGQGLAVGDLPGVLQRLHSMAADPPKDLKRYWYKLFDREHPVIFGRDGKPNHEFTDGGLAPMASRSIRPLADNGVELEPEWEHFEPDSYGNGWMPIPGITHTLTQQSRAVWWKVYCHDRGVPECYEPGTWQAEEVKKARAAFREIEAQICGQGEDASSIDNEILESSS